MNISGSRLSFGTRMSYRNIHMKYKNNRKIEEWITKKLVGKSVNPIGFGYWSSKCQNSSTSSKPKNSFLESFLHSVLGPHLFVFGTHIYDFISFMGPHFAKIPFRKVSRLVDDICVGSTSTIIIPQV